MGKQERLEEAKEMLEALSNERSLGAWETDFVNSLQIQVESGRTLSEKQFDKLDEVWQRVYEKG